MLITLYRDGAPLKRRKFAIGVLPTRMYIVYSMCFSFSEAPGAKMNDKFPESDRTFTKSRNHNGID